MYQRILVPVDGSSTSNKALVAALQLARDSGGRVQLAHVIDEMTFLAPEAYSPDMYEIIRENAQKVLNDAHSIAAASGVPSDDKLIDQPGTRLGDLIAAAASEWEADLVVVGTHGRRGFSRALLGSGAEQIIRLAPVPVLVVRGDPTKI
jgi:nucleotide-binding universal stress UspA family protein